jgi:hypothetical protein
LEYQEEIYLDGKKMDVKEKKEGEDRLMLNWREKYIRKY